MGLPALVNALATVAVLATDGAIVGRPSARPRRLKGALVGQGIRVGAGIILNALNSALKRARQQALVQILNALDNAVGPGVVARH